MKMANIRRHVILLVLKVRGMPSPCMPGLWDRDTSKLCDGNGQLPL